MTINIAFTLDGDPWTKDIARLLEEHIVAAIPDDIAWWRLSYNLETETVDVLYPTMTNAEADVQLPIDRAAAFAADQAAEAVALAARIAALP
tara:strand:+ start:807 stop:1082 length:276 start_codon:yes stop_codon:yes gene_type:complete